MPPIPSSLPIRRATSYSRNLRTYFALPARSWRVFSTHTHACNLLSSEGEWMALVDQQHGNGPFHVVMPAAILRQREANEIVHVADNFLHFSEASLDLHSAKLWEPHLEPVTLRSHTLSWLHEKIQMIDSPLFTSTPSARQTLATLAAPLIEQLCQGLQQGEQAQIIQAAQQLAGLGPGLTPAGDDFLLGLMAAFTLHPPRLAQNLISAAICAAIGNAAAQRTTRLSGQWLHAAGRGEFGAAWHQLANALEKADQAPIQQAIARILAAGATSGADALRGFGMGLTLNPV
ncbi:MAG: DUF2877 domain-containing protein [Chloroflexi bacterium]|nr:DUF2877 domain-containing protein [Chloroflexota bacterium]